MLKNIKNYKLFLFSFIVLILFLFISFTNPFANLTKNQKIILAQAYYKVALYYYSQNNKEKGDAFKSVAHYLDPNFVQKEFSLIQGPLDDEEVKNRINKIKENADQFIIEFFKTKEKNYLSYPVYNLKTADLFTDESIDALLNIEQIEYFFSNDFIVQKTEYENAAKLSSFLSLIYLEDDLIYILHDKNNEKILILLIRNFGLDLKIIGFLPFTEKTVIR
ncbi:MAG: hypothetical protein ACK4YF_04595 [Exilispira sp.]